MLRDLTTDLIINERIETTETRAEELRSVVEKMITLGKRGDLHARRQRLHTFATRLLMKKITKMHFKDYSLTFATRYEELGGYTYYEAWSSPW